MVWFLLLCFNCAKLPFFFFGGGGSSLGQNYVDIQKRCKNRYFRIFGSALRIETEIFSLVIKRASPAVQKGNVFAIIKFQSGPLNNY